MNLKLIQYFIILLITYSTNSSLIINRIKRGVVTQNHCVCTGGFTTNSQGVSICQSDCNGNSRKAMEVDCKFPFQYNGVWYDTCTDVNSPGVFWCSLDSVYTGKKATCSQKCPWLARNLVNDSTSNIHTSCSKQETSWSGKLPTDDEIKLILKEHNNIRSNVTVSAADLKTLNWDYALSRLALNLVQTGLFKHDCSKCRTLLNNLTIKNGQNLFQSSGIQYNSNFWIRPIASWYNEINNFKLGVGSINGGVIGHYTQMISNYTVSVGCALAQNGNTILAACNYAGGQYDMANPYTPGTSCKNCNSCSNKLCNCNKLCQNYGTLNTQDCTCKCPSYATGSQCEKLLCNLSDKAYGCWASSSSQCTYSNIPPICPHMCGICDYINFTS